MSKNKKNEIKKINPYDLISVSYADKKNVYSIDPRRENPYNRLQKKKYHSNFIIEK